MKKCETCKRELNTVEVDWYLDPVHGKYHCIDCGALESEYNRHVKYMLSEKKLRKEYEGVYLSNRALADRAMVAGK